MTFSKLARLLGKGSVLARDINAVQRGRIGERLANRLIGRAWTAFMRGKWL